MELNNGTLTIKEGTKGYNGNGLFYTVTSDITYTTSTNDTYFVYLKDTSPYFRVSNRNESGTSVSSGYTGAFFHTDTGICNFYSSGTLTENLSLPIAIITVSNGAISSIDQVFNGFGYIGSTAFILPGVKVQAPNGKNEDGTYKSNILTQSSVGLTTFTTNAAGALVVRPNSSIPIFTASWHFDSENGYISTSDNIPTNYGACILCGYLRTESLKIVNFKVGDVDSVANSNASNFSAVGKSYLSGLGIPTHINGSLVSNSAASETDFVAPCNGVFKLNGVTTSAGSGYCQLLNITQYLATSGQIFMQYGGGFYAAGPGQFCRAVGEVKKGDVIRIQYSSNIAIGGQGYGEGLFFLPFEGEN